MAPGKQEDRTATESGGNSHRSPTVQILQRMTVPCTHQEFPIAITSESPQEAPPSARTGKWGLMVSPGEKKKNLPRCQIEFSQFVSN